MLEVEPHWSARSYGHRKLPKRATYRFAAIGAIKKVKGKDFPYSLPTVGPGADPSVQVVSPQVT